MALAASVLLPVAAALYELRACTRVQGAVRAICVPRHTPGAALQSDGHLQKRVIDTVRGELAEEERAAQEHLAALRERHPNAAKQAVTLQMAVALLGRKVRPAGCCLSPCLSAIRLAPT